MATSVTYDVYAKDRASKTFKDVGNSALNMGSLGKKAAIGLAAIGTAVAATTVAAGVFAYKVGSDYVASLNKIQALTGSNDATMTRAAKTLESNSSLYAKMGQTTGDAAAGVVELTKAGLSLQDSLKAVNATMILAKAGELSVADASTLVANSLNTFGLKASQAGKIANQLANAANISSADVSDLAESFKYVAPIAASAGVSMAQVNAILAELSNSGIKASVAGTGLRKFLLSLQSPAGAAAKDLSDLNVEIFDASGKMKPLGDIIGQLGGKMKGLSDKARSKDLKDIFGLQSMASAQVILKNGVKGLDEYTKGVNKAGAAQRLAEAQTKGLAGTISMLKATVTSTAQSFYRQFSPLVNQALMPLAQWLTRISTQAAPALRREIQSLEPEFNKLEPKIAKLANEVQHNLYPAFQAALQSLKKNRPQYEAFANSIIKATPPILKLASAILGKVIPPLVRLNSVMSRLNLPFTVAWFTKATNAAGAFASGLLKAGDSAGQFGSAVKTKVGQAMTYVQSIPGKVRSAVGNLGSVLYGAGQAAVDGLIAGIKSKIPTLGGVLGGVGSFIKSHKGPIEKDRVMLKPAGVAIMEGLMAGITSQSISLQRVLDAVTGRVQAANSKLKTAISNRNSFAAGFQDFSSSAFGADYGTDDAGNSISPTVDSILAYQRQQRDQAKTVKTDVRKLVKMGLSPALIKQLQAQGAAGIPEIEALAGASRSQIRQYNSLNKQTTSDLHSAGMTAANRLYGQQIKQDRKADNQSRHLLQEIRDLLKREHEAGHEVVEVRIKGHDLVAILKKTQRTTGAHP